jgi:hypothetical protein
MNKLLYLYTALYLFMVWTWKPIWAADQRFYLPIFMIITLFIARGICRK